MKLELNNTTYVTITQTNFFLRKMFFRLVTSVEQRNNSEYPQGIEPQTFGQIPRSDALPLSHRDSTVSEVYFEVHMTRVLHTARISSVDSLIFADRIKGGGKFWAR